MRFTHLRRREFITALGGAAAMWPLATQAQQFSRVRRIGVLFFYTESDPEGQARAAAFREALQKLGWSDGNNIRIDYRWYLGDVDKARRGSAELMRLAPDVIVSSGAEGLVALQQLTRTVPIVFVMTNELVANGFVQNLARPRGNITGFTTYEPTMGARWLELIKEVAPQLTSVAIMFNPRTSTLAAQYVSSAEAAAKKAAVEPLTVQVHSAAEIAASITMLGQKPRTGLVVVPDGFTQIHSNLITQLAASRKLHAIYPFRHFTDDGGLISFGVNTVQVFRQAAVYVDRILRGEQAAGLPVQQPTSYELVINLRVAKALGLDIPPTLIARADKVIE